MHHIIVPSCLHAGCGVVVRGGQYLTPGNKHCVASDLVTLAWL